MKLLALSLVATIAGAQSASWKEAAAILDRRCNSCHRAGQVGPFDFTQYDGASAYAPEIIRYVGEDKMPPWRAKEGQSVFSNARRLTAGEKASLLAWAKSGAKGGDATPPPRNPLWNLGTPDLILDQPKEYTVSAEKTVEIVPVEFSAGDLGTTGQDRYLQAIEFRSSNRSLLHHAVLRIGGQPIAAWAMCDTGLRLPSLVAWRLPKGQALTVELHYFKRNLRTARDRTRVALYFASQKPARLAELLELSKDDLRIPPSELPQLVKLEAIASSDLQLHAVLPVLQLLATSAALFVDNKQLLSVLPFEHHLMTSYVLARPLPLHKGAQLVAQATYFNSTKNPNNPHQQLRDVRAAENGLDETFRFWLTVSRPNR